MLESYLNGVDIEGMLRHNVFVAEKSSSKVYLQQAICKYDEAVRDRARVEGARAYTGGDMSLAMRFLSTEHTRPKSQTPYNNSYGKTVPNKKSGISQNNQNGSTRQYRQVCWQFNSSGCTFDTYKYPHVCSRCFIPGHAQHSCKTILSNAAQPQYTA